MLEHAAGGLHSCSAGNRRMWYCGIVRTKGSRGERRSRNRGVHGSWLKVLQYSVVRRDCTNTNLYEVLVPVARVGGGWAGQTEPGATGGVQRSSQRRAGARALRGAHSSFFWLKLSDIRQNVRLTYCWLLTALEGRSASYSCPGSLYCLPTISMYVRLLRTLRQQESITGLLRVVVVVSNWYLSN